MEELQRFFTEAVSVLPAKAAPMVASTARLASFFIEAKTQVEQAEEQDRTRASGFNVFNLIKPDENKLSSILVLLLSPREAHGQGDLFLRLFLERLGTGLKTTGLKDAWVHREAQTGRIVKSQRRIDVLVDVGDLVGIENKIEASEQPEQVKDYLAHLFACTLARKTRSTLVYLTPDGKRPDSLTRQQCEQEIAGNRLRCWAYGGQLRSWLEACRSECEAPRICDFISSFINYIDQTVARNPASEDIQTPHET